MTTQELIKKNELRRRAFLDNMPEQTPNKGLIKVLIEDADFWREEAHRQNTLYQKAIGKQ